MEELFAHYEHETGRSQLLEDHLFIVAEESFIVASEIEKGYISLLIGLYHDLGKSSTAFQTMMLNQTKEKIDHSSAGAKYLFDRIGKTLIENQNEVSDCMQYATSFIEIICYVISAHHGLYDIPLTSDSENDKNFAYSKLIKRIMNNYSAEYQEQYETEVVPYAQLIEKKFQLRYNYSLDFLILKAFTEYVEMWQALKPFDDSEKSFYEGLTVRLLLSILKNADILDTINAYNDEVILPINQQQYKTLANEYLEGVERRYSSYRQSTEMSTINKIRTSIAEIAKERGKLDSSGIYRLDLPTGAGKTNLSMRYSFHQMVYQGKKRFFYVAPFLSILEQNSFQIKKTIGFNSSGVLEHHSNINNDEREFDDSKEIVMKNYLLDTWDSPIVLTTMVQLFQTLFKSKSSNIRRFSNLMNSVLVLDEVQALPVEVTTLFNLTMNFLNQVMKVNIVLCTATQPVYDSKEIKHKIKYGGRKGEAIDLIEMTKEERKIFERTEVFKFNEDNALATLEDIAEEINKYPKETILVILNTKKAVSHLYELIKKQNNRRCYHLSTNMCAKHRLAIINTMKKEMADEPLVCISSQLIEAGVDLDFNRVIRSYAGIDSIVQASGRCNREGNLDKGVVKLVNITNEQENLDPIGLKAIKDKKGITEQVILKKTSPILIEELNNEFFERYYSNTKSQEFDYPTQKDNPTIFELLSLNKESKLLPELILHQSFKTAGEKMDLIKDDSFSVIVYYDNNNAKIEALIAAIKNFEITYEIGAAMQIKKLVRELQQYTISMRATDKFKSAVMFFKNDQIAILQEDYYDEEVGIKEAEVFIY